MRLTPFVAALLMAGTAGAQDSTAARPLISTLTGVYSEKQASRGEEVFTRICLACHATSDYTGEEFKGKYAGGLAYDVFEVIRSSMPQDDPGSLTRQQYADIVAYLFKLNAIPSGSKELSTEKDSLKAIKVEMPKNPSRLR